MKRFADDKLEEIYHTRFATGLPKAVTAGAHEVAHLLAASASLQDVGVFRPIIPLGGSPKRYASHVHGKWHIIWQWSDDYGAHEMSLERL